MATIYSSTASDWIPLVEYAHKKGISLSTLRRHIKSGKIPYKVDQGRYLLFDDSGEKVVVPAGYALAPSSSDKSPQAQIAELKLQLQQAQEEVAELKTLIAFYEERTHHQRPEV